MCGWCAGCARDPCGDGGITDGQSDRGWNGAMHFRWRSGRPSNQQVVVSQAGLRGCRVLRRFRPAARHRQRPRRHPCGSHCAAAHNRERPLWGEHMQGHQNELLPTNICYSPNGGGHSPQGNVGGAWDSSEELVNFCTNCGGKLDMATTRFCRSCGASTARKADGTAGPAGDSQRHENGAPNIPSIGRVNRSILPPSPARVAIRPGNTRCSSSVSSRQVLPLSRRSRSCWLRRTRLRPHRPRSGRCINQAGLTRRFRALQELVAPPQATLRAGDRTIRQRSAAKAHFQSGQQLALADTGESVRAPAMGPCHPSSTRPTTAQGNCRQPPGPTTSRQPMPWKGSNGTTSCPSRVQSTRRRGWRSTRNCTPGGSPPAC